MLENILSARHLPNYKLDFQYLDSRIIVLYHYVQIIMSGSKITPLSFEWDEYNKEKNWNKHKVDYKECEDVFLYKKLKIFPDEKHSGSEARFLGLGTTSKGRILSIVFTLRNNVIRIISARDMSRKERRIYEKK